jgi:hypothetical protein
MGGHPSTPAIGGIMKITRAAVAVVAGFGLVAVLVSPASAGKPDQVREHVVFTEEDQDVCGVNVDVVVDVRFNDREFFDDEGNFERFLGTSSGSNTFINDAGESVTVTFSNVSRAVDLAIDEETGLITVLISTRGLPEKIRSTTGTILTRDAGLITFVNVFDPSIDEVISQEIIVNKGPHPQAESDFELFCEIITAELG